MKKLRFSSASDPLAGAAGNERERLQDIGGRRHCRGAARKAARRAFGTLLAAACLAVSVFPALTTPAYAADAAVPAHNQSAALPPGTAGGNSGDQPVIACPAEPLEDDYYLSDYYFEYLDRRQEAAVTLTKVSVATTKEGDYYKSMVHLTLQNKGYTLQEIHKDPSLAYSSRWDRQQYSTSFYLPDGVFVSNYYLDVYGVRKYGLLAERNAALWIYDSVVSRAMDPGLVYYEGNNLTLRVFPFAPSETRYTGIEFLHKEPVTLNIDGHAVKLAPQAAAADSKPQYIGENAIYLSAASKTSLPMQGRKPHYVFVADCSSGSDVEELARRLRSFTSANNIVRDEATIYATGDRRKVIPMSNANWDQSLTAFPKGETFRFSAAVKAIVQEYADKDTYPVIIGLRGAASSDKVSWPAQDAEIAQEIPELSGYYMLTGDSLRQYYFDSRPDRALDRLPSSGTRVKTQIGGETYWIHDNGRPEILARSTSGNGRAPQGQWEQAVALMAEYRGMADKPESEQPVIRLGLVRSSFESKVMLPVTSFITLETEEQETRMLNYQKKLLESGDIEAEYQKRQDDSMWDYDDDDDGEEPDDEDGVNPSTGGDGDTGNANANPATGGDTAGAAANGSRWHLLVIPALCMAILLLRRKQPAAK